jgi:ubiquinone/menaquinone biosynthesis C-methylase UbiE
VLLEAEAERYDRTRRASPSLLGPLQLLVDGMPGQRLLDLGSGTGNYAACFAEQGLEVVHLDVHEGMVRRAVAKTTGTAGVVADANRLPFHAGAFDRVICINMLHLVRDWGTVLERVLPLVRRGRVVLELQTAENCRGNWASYYFPTQARLEALRSPSERDVVDVMRLLGYQRVKVRHFSYTDLDDANMAALKHWPTRYLDPDIRANNAFFTRMDPDELQAGLQELERDYLSGSLWHLIEHYRPAARRYGDGTFFSADTP